MAGTSHGRGGAGNFAKPSAGLNPADLQDLATPTIKSSTYTTGRGGTGNMQPNVHPDITRQTQDVDAPPRTGRKPESGFQYGRGGAGNTVIPTKEEIVNLREQSRQREAAEAAAAAAEAKGKGKEKESMDEKPKKESKKDQRTVVGSMLQRVMSKDNRVEK